LLRVNFLVGYRFDTLLTETTDLSAALSVDTPFCPHKTAGRRILLTIGNVS